MAGTLKEFSSITAYNNYASTSLTGNTLRPNVSYVRSGDHVNGGVFYNPKEPELTGKYIVIDDFPYEDFGYESIAEFVEEEGYTTDGANRYNCIGKMTYGGIEYYLWELDNLSSPQVQYILTERCSFLPSETLEGTNYTSAIVPFSYILNNDKEMVYGNDDFPDPYLLVDYWDEDE